MSTFNLKFNESKTLKGIVETLTSVIDEIEIIVTPDALIFTAMDPSRICLLKLTLKKENFDEYKFTGIDTYKLGICLDDLNKIIKRSAINDTIRLIYDHEAQKIKVIMERETTKRKRTFSLSLLDMDQEEIPFENLLKIDYSSKMKINPNIIAEAIKDGETYSDILSLKLSEIKGVLFNSFGQIGEMNYELGLDELEEHDINGDCNGSYSISFLKAILKLSTITKELEISLKTDHPLKMVFTLQNEDEVLYFLAPRVEEEDLSDMDDDELEDF